MFHTVVLANVTYQPNTINNSMKIAQNAQYSIFLYQRILKDQAPPHDVPSLHSAK